MRPASIGAQTPCDGLMKAPLGSGTPVRLAPDQIERDLAVGDSRVYFARAPLWGYAPAPVTERVFFVDIATCRGQAEVLFREVEARVRALLPGVSVEHVGSTSLPDGLTKGDLDVQVRVGADDSLWRGR